MRTLIILLAGFTLWGISIGLTRLFAPPSASSTTIATAAFIVTWLAATAFNMWVGVTKAGYSFQEELPIFLLLFLLPVAAAVFVKWKFL